MLLCIDSGNSKTKWAVFNSTGEISHVGSCLNNGLSAKLFPPATLYQRVMLSNVAGEKQQACLINHLAGASKPVHTLQSSACLGELRNHYQPAQSLGSDRFAAMLAAYHMTGSSCVVVNAGTAVTIDALSIKHKQADFIGGWILPGYQLMQQSLTLNTAQLPNTVGLSPLANKAVFADNTQDAMQLGALHGIIGAIQCMLNALSERDGHASLIVSGGDASLIKSHLPVTTPCTIVDNLVLHGLYFIDRLQQSESP
jgi:type III pantothenate kinase